MSNSRHFVSMKMTNELIVASRIYVAMCIVFWIYIFCLRMVERCALVATAVQLYRTFPHRIGPLFEFIFLSFKTSVWITLVDYFGEDNCRTYYESELVGLCRLRFCNFLRCGLYFTKAEEFYACSENQRIHSFCSSRPSVHSFSEASPVASREVGPLRDYMNLLRSRTGKDVLIHFDQDSDYSEECQRIFKEVSYLNPTPNFCYDCLTFLPFRVPHSGTSYKIELKV